MSDTLARSCVKSADDWQPTLKLLTERAERVLSWGLWTDCTFLVGIGSNLECHEAHKLILAMSSPVFAAMFFGDLAETGDIVISDIEPAAFYSVLYYIYTEKVTLSSFDEASKICYAAKKYMLPHLVKECITYMWSDLRPTNVCQAYEFANSFDEKYLMNKCLRMIRENTKQVLSESGFDDLGLDTIKTIYEQKELNIDSELDLYSAIERYAANLDKDCNNKTKIHEVLKNIHFLSLTSKEFAEGPANSNLLTESEKYAIIINIGSENSKIPMPKGFSTTRTQRQYKVISLRKNIRKVSRFVDVRNTHVMNFEIRFTCMRDVTIYGIEIPSQMPPKPNLTHYSEAIYAYIDWNGKNISSTHFNGRVPYKSTIEIKFQEPILIVGNREYKLGVTLNKTGCYPIGIFECEYTYSSIFSDEFSFVKDEFLNRDGVVRKIIYALGHRKCQK